MEKKSPKAKPTDTEPVDVHVVLDGQRVAATVAASMPRRVAVSIRRPYRTKPARGVEK